MFPSGAIKTQSVEEWKAQMCVALAEIKAAHQWTNVEMGMVIGTGPARVSAILNAHIEKLSVEALLDYLDKTGTKTTVTLALSYEVKNVPKIENMPREEVFEELLTLSKKLNGADQQRLKDLAAYIRTNTPPAPWPNES
jgi:hypothetical protein